MIRPNRLSIGAVTLMVIAAVTLGSAGAAPVVGQDRAPVLAAAAGTAHA